MNDGTRRVGQVASITPECTTAVLAPGKRSGSAANVAQRVAEVPLRLDDDVATGVMQGPAWDFSDVPVRAPEVVPTGHAESAVAELNSPFPILPKLVLGRADDPLEHEADRVADRVMRMADPIAGATEPVTRFGNAAPRASYGSVGRTVVDGVLNEPGRPMDQASRAYFEPRFGRSFADVRVHDDPAAATAACAIGAHAFAAGPHLAFAEGRYEPGTHRGRHLLAHELAHVVQTDLAGSTQAVVRREIAEDKLAQTPVTQIMADPNYFENGIARIEFYGAELARLIYADNKQLDLGLVPGQIHAPVEAVDYRTVRSVHVAVNQEGAVGSLDFVPRGTQVKTSGGVSFGDVVAATSRKIRFTHDPGSGRIVPTEVNSISAPRLCEALRGAEAVYVKNTDAIAKGMVQFLTVLNYSLMIYSFVRSLVGAVGKAATATEEAAEGGAAAAAGVLSRAQSVLLSLFIRLLRTGTAEDITVEGVGFSGVRATLRGTELIVERDAIVNVSRVAGQGRLVNAAFEQAAIAAARQAGAATARVAFHTVVNAEWSAYLESLGYSFEVIAGTTPGSIVTRVLTKVIAL